MEHIISSKKLSIIDIQNIIDGGRTLRIGDEARRAIVRCREYLDSKMEDLDHPRDKPGAAAAARAVLWQGWARQKLEQHAERASHFRAGQAPSGNIGAIFQNTGFGGIR